MKINGSFKPQFSPYLPYDLIQIKRELQAIYDSLSESARKFDVESAMSWAHPDFQMESVDGTHNVQESKVRLKFLWKRIETQTYTEVIESLSRSGQEIKCTTKSVAIIHWKPSNPNLLPVRTETTNEDTWIKTSDGWRIKASTKIESKSSFERGSKKKASST